MERYNYAKLIGLIRAAGLTQEQFARKIGICPSSLYQRLHNNRDFRKDEITRVCSVLQIPSNQMPDYFFTHSL